MEGKKVTIIEAARLALTYIGKASDINRIYEVITKNNLYSFHEKNALSELKFNMLRSCEDCIKSKKFSNIIFYKQDNLFGLLKWRNSLNLMDYDNFSSKIELSTDISKEDIIKKGLVRLKEFEIPFIKPKEEYFCTFDEKHYLEDYLVIYKNSDVIVVYCKKNKTPVSILVDYLGSESFIKERNYMFFRINSNKKQELIKWRHIENTLTSTEYFVYYYVEDGVKEYKLIYKDNIAAVLLDKDNAVSLISCYELEHESTIYKRSFIKIRIYKTENVENDKVYNSFKTQKQIKDLQKGDKDKNTKEEFINKFNIKRISGVPIENKKKEIEKNIDIDFENMIIINPNDLGNIKPLHKYVLLGKNAEYKIIYRDDLITIVLGNDKKVLVINNIKFNHNNYDFLEKGLKLYRIEDESKNIRFEQKEDISNNIKEERLEESTFKDVAKELFNNLDNLF